MKQVINGKFYNTEAAQEICAYQYGYPKDFDYVLEELYRKKNEEFSFKSFAHINYCSTFAASNKQRQ